MKVNITDIDWDKEEDDDTFLPENILVKITDIFPEGDFDLADMDDGISDWLSDTYGYCHNGFNYEVEY